MRPKYRTGIAILLALITADLAFYLADWNYNWIRDPFVLWKSAVKFGVPFAAVMIWSVDSATDLQVPKQVTIPPLPSRMSQQSATTFAFR